jgi:hypothetical protein
MEDVGILNCRFVYFTAKWFILWPFGTFSGHLVYFFRFGMLCREISGNPVFQIQVLFYKPRGHKCFSFLCALNTKENQSALSSSALLPKFIANLDAEYGGQR